MTLGERLLLRLSRDPRSADYAEGVDDGSLDTALDLLLRVCPDLSGLVGEGRVLDFGCGIGYQSVALAERWGASVVGVDTNASSLARAIALRESRGLSPSRVSFVSMLEERDKASFDLIISQNSFEHFQDPTAVLSRMAELIRPGGRILLTFGPPWFAPYGSHMHFFCRVPWLNLLFAESTVMAVRSRYRHDGATRYEDVEAGLNRMTIARFERIIAASGLHIVRSQYECVKGMTLLGKLPLVRELFINHVTTLLRREL